MFSGTADIELANGILLHDNATAAGVDFELYLAEGRGHGVARTEPRDFAWLDYATDFFARSGAIDVPPAPEALSGELKKYNGEPVAGIAAPPESNPSRPHRQRKAPPEVKSAPAPPPAAAPVAEKAKAGDSSTSDLEPILGQKGRLLLEETFEGDALADGWTGKTGGLSVAGGVLHASMKSADGRLGLFNREQPMQDAAIQIDFKFAGARGINISCNPSPGELSKHGHLFSVMITQRMWNITEHNDKSDPASSSKALSTASANFETGKWYTVLVECKGGDVVARVEGKEPLRAEVEPWVVTKSSRCIGDIFIENALERLCGGRGAQAVGSSWRVSRSLNSPVSVRKAVPKGDSRSDLMWRRPD